jgi:hypothetical protein
MRDHYCAEWDLFERRLRREPTEIVQSTPFFDTDSHPRKSTAEFDNDFLLSYFADKYALTFFRFAWIRFGRNLGHDWSQ